jgi:hypothetical protein
MATERERFREDAENNGYAAKALDDTATEDGAQRSYIAFKLFQIGAHLRRITETGALGRL